VGDAIQPGVLDQNIKAVQEGPSGRIAAGIGLDRVNDNSLLSVKSPVNKTKREGDLMHDYGGNWANGRVGGCNNTEGQVLWDGARYTGDAGAVASCQDPVPR